VVARPEREAARAVGAAADLERMQVEERADRLEVEAGDDGVGVLAPSRSSRSVAISGPCTISPG
jgi:hypothetical protein